MKVVTSHERSYGSGENQFTAVAHLGRWWPVSCMLGASYTGQVSEPNSGKKVDEYKLAVPDSTPHAKFHRRANRQESVTIYTKEGQVPCESFAKADKWLEARS